MPFPLASRFPWLKRKELTKPDHQIELPESNESGAEEEAAIERERQRRIADRQD
jgi:hypothetical protein